MKLSLQTGSSDDVLRVLVAGDIRHPKEFSDALDPLEKVAGKAYCSKRVLLDLSDANYIGSTGIGWLLGLNRKVTSAGGRLVLHSIPPLVDDVFRLMRLYLVLTIAEGPAAAEELAHAAVSTTSPVS